MRKGLPEMKVVIPAQKVPRKNAGPRVYIEKEYYFFVLANTLTIPALVISRTTVSFVLLKDT